jgi:hypothetical protein
MSGEARMNPPTEIKIRDVITLTARLAQLLAEEVDLLSAMKVSKIAALQKEKIFLTNAIEAHRKMLVKHPGFSETIPSQDKHDLKEVMGVFKDILEENHRKLLLAKEVNHKIVQAITDVVKEKTQSKVYSASGVTGAAAFESVSVTLNETI